MDAPLCVTAELVNEKVRFSGSARDLPPVSADYFPPLGDGQGYSGLELLLLSLAACSATSIVSMMRRMKKTVAAFRVNASGTRREHHPTSFSRIVLAFTLSSPDAAEADLQKAIQLSAETYCPVWAMLKGSVEIVPVLKVIAPGA
jgi:putative redox protein